MIPADNDKHLAPANLLRLEVSKERNDLKLTVVSVPQATSAQVLQVVLSQIQNIICTMPFVLLNVV